MTTISSKGLVIFALCGVLLACSRKDTKTSEEQIRLSGSETSEETERVEGDSLQNAVARNSNMKQVPTFPSQVILTGLTNHRLLGIYKLRQRTKTKDNIVTKLFYESDGGGVDTYEHYMPGIDILYGYNLFNLAHYDLASGQSNYLFKNPVLIKTLYYPSFVQDSVNKQPINRNYYLVSVYDEDTNRDTLINKKDLRHLFWFSASTDKRTMLLPADYGVVRSQYDPANDVMYVFARQDVNKNGMQDNDEPLHVFWFSLAAPDAAKRFY